MATDEVGEGAPTVPERTGKTRLLTMADLDRRTKSAQTAIAHRAAIIADLGGEDRLSTLERIAADHAALAAAVVQDTYVRWLAGEQVPLAELGTVQNSFLRLASALGFSRRTKDITPNIDSYLERPLV